MILISILIKASLLLAVAAIAQALIARRTSAATRHLLWTLALVALMLLPMLVAALPGWTAVRITATSAPAAMPSAGSVEQVTVSAADPPALLRSADSSRRQSPVELTWATALTTVYAAGVILLLVRLGTEQRTIGRLARRATEVSDPQWTRLFLDCARQLNVRRPVRLLRSREQTMPMAIGAWHAAILIPAVADTWDENRRRAVLLHELAHVARYDCLTQLLSAVACALYWVHPAVWWVGRQFRLERELACDDRVLSAGTRAREYAGHLLELAYALGGNRAPSLAVTMARPSQLEGRMLAVLDAARNRTTPARRSRLAGLAVMTALVIPVAAATMTVMPASSGNAPVALPDAASAPAPAQAPASAQEQLPGTWQLRPSREAGLVQLRLTDEDGSYGRSIEIARLEGLTAAQLAGEGLVRFSMRRDAGTFTFDGVVRNGVGGGTYSFTPSTTFAADMAKRGFDRPTVADQRLLAREDISFAFLDELSAQRYTRPNLAQLIRAAQHGVNLVYVREMGGLGYRPGVLEALVELRDHGVTPQYVRGLSTQGLPRLSIEDLVRARDHGVNPEEIGELHALGHRALDLDQLVRLRDHGVSAEYIRALDQAGFRNLPLEVLVDARNHGISPEYVRDIRALGYTLTLDDLTKARNHGVSPEYIRDLAALGYQRLPLEALIRLRDHGVDPKFVREFNELGYAGLSIDDLVGLRDHGVTPERVRAANARAGTRLSVERLKAAADRGWR